MIIVAVDGKSPGLAMAQLARLAGPRARVVPARGLLGGADVLVSLGGAARCPAARVLVASGESAADAARACGADIVISVGADMRNTVTPSSVMDGGMAALQREITSLGGQRVEPREIDLSAISGSIDEKMAVAAAMLIIDPQAKW